MKVEVGRRYAPPHRRDLVVLDRGLELRNWIEDSELCVPTSELGKQLSHDRGQNKQT